MIVKFVRRSVDRNHYIFLHMYNNAIYIRILNIFKLTHPFEKIVKSYKMIKRSIIISNLITT